nr:MAG TPA: hypothetical protein [Caudoviricetes sp.]
MFIALALKRPRPTTSRVSHLCVWHSSIYHIGSPRVKLKMAQP